MIKHTDAEIQAKVEELWKVSNLHTRITQYNESVMIELTSESDVTVTADQLKALSKFFNTVNGSINRTRELSDQGVESAGFNIYIFPEE